MTGEMKKVLMAHAMGVAFGIPDKRVELKDLCPEWAGYELVYWPQHNNKNANYTLWCNDGFGIEGGFSRLTSIACGYNLNHMIHLLITSLELHKSETK